MSLKNMLKSGMIVKYRNGDNNFYNNGVFLDNSFDVCNHIDNYANDLKALYTTTGNLDIIKIYDPNEFGLKLVWERCDSILTRKEKEYLSVVVSPFRDRVEYIIKRNFMGGGKYKVCIYLNDDFINLPYFESNDLFKNMELNKKYTLAELGL